MPILKLSIVATLVLLQGCSSIIHSYGEFADAQDPCQMKHKPADHVKPEFCKYGRGYQQTVRIYTPQGGLIGLVK